MSNTTQSQFNLRLWHTRFFCVLSLASLLWATLSNASSLNKEACTRELQKIEALGGDVAGLCEDAILAREKPSRGLIAGCYVDLTLGRNQSPADALNVCSYLVGRKAHVEERDSCLQRVLNHRSKEGREVVYAMNVIYEPMWDGATTADPNDVRPDRFFRDLDDEGVAAEFCLNTPSVIECSLGQAKVAFGLSYQQVGNTNAFFERDLFDVMWDSEKILPKRFPFTILGKAANMCQQVLR